MDIRFWGVRGSVPVSGERFARTGGNTSCVELCHDGERLILDGGTGLAQLGEALAAAPPVRATLLFSHIHWDHIQGVPFFGPAYDPRTELQIIGACRDGRGIQADLDAQMRPPHFPVGLDAMRAQIQWGSLTPGRQLKVGPFTIEADELDHPNGILAFRIEAGGCTVVYATDTEHGERIDPRLLALAQGADLLIHDAQYTSEEYRGVAGPPRRGWGHSTWGQAVEAAQRADVDRLALFHHDPRRSDRDVAAIETAAVARHHGCFAAREGTRIAL